MTDFFSRVRNMSTSKGATPAADSAPPVSLEPARVSPADHPSSGIGAPDILGVTPLLRRMAALLAQPGAQSSLTAAIFGGPGAGKSFALDRLLAETSQLASQGGATRLVAARVDARLGADAASAIAGAIHKALLQPAPGARAYPALAQEAAQADTNPEDAARKAQDRLIATRRQLDSERQALQELSGKQTRIADNILYEAQGSRIESFARANRAMLENRLRAFGFTGGDPVATFKDIVRDVGERGGIIGRISAFIRALWAFRGQMRLIVLAILFALIAWGAGVAQETRETWLAPLKNMESLKAATAWIEANIGLLAMVKSAAFWAAIAALALNVFRAFRFLSPVWRGASFLREDIGARRRELENLVANQARRVEDMASEVETLAAQAAAVEKRAQSTASQQRPAAIASPFASQQDGVRARAETFIAAIAERVSRNSADAPQRIVVAIDNIDDLPSPQAAEFAARAQSLLSAPCFAAVFTSDIERLRNAPELRHQLQRMIEAPLSLPNPGEGFSKLIASMLGRETSATDTPDSIALDEPMRPAEPELLEALAPLAGRSPRDVKRFVNLYRLARPGVESFAPLALALALQTGGSAQERDSIAAQLRDGSGEDALRAENGSRLDTALKAAGTAQSGPVTVAQMRAAGAIAAVWSMDI